VDPISSAKRASGFRRWLLIAVAGGTVLLAVAAVLHQLTRQREHQQHLQDETTVVVRRDVDIKVSAAGSIKPLTPVNISPKAAGKVAALLVDQGDEVKAGKILARMDHSNLVGQLLRAKGNLAAAKGNLLEAEAQLPSIEANYRSNQQLYKAGGVSYNNFIASQSQFFASQSHIVSLRGQVVQAQGELATAQAQMNDTLIRAPFSGVVTQKYANVGSFVTPTTSASATTSATSSSILALAGPLEAVASVSEIDEPSIYKGQPVEIRVDAYPNLVVHGHVRLIAPESVVVQNVTSFEVRITIDHRDISGLRSGMNITASFLVGEHKNALIIPTPAIVSQKEGNGVYVFKNGQSPLFRSIKVGATVGNATEVLAGLKQGERIYITFPGGRKPNSKPVTASSPFAQPGGQGRPPR
jgi:HlyD family secretion protein